MTLLHAQARADRGPGIQVLTNAVQGVQPQGKREPSQLDSHWLSATALLHQFTAACAVETAAAIGPAVTRRRVALAIGNPVQQLQQMATLLASGQQVLLLNPHLPLVQQQQLASRNGCELLCSGRQEWPLAPSADTTHWPAATVCWSICSSGTSSTSGTPRTYSFDLNRSLENASAHMASLGFSRQIRHRILLPLPISHSFGMVAGVLGALQYQADLFIADYGISALGILRAAVQQEIDSLYLTPSQVMQLNALLQRQPDIAKPSLQRISIGSAPLRARDLLRLMAHFPATDFYTTYGLTEMGPRVSTFHAGTGRDPHAALTLSPEQVTPLGQPLPGVELKVEQQRLWIRSPYRALQLDTNNDGFHDSQDYCHQDEQGQRRISGRADDTIIRSGINIYPQEVEALLTDIAGLQSACLVGIASRAYGQIPVLVCQIDAAQLQPAAIGADHPLQRQILARLQQALPVSHLPARILYRSDLPRTSLGKIQRQVLARTITESLSGGH